MSATHLVRCSQSTGKDLVELIRREIAEQLGRLGLAARTDLADLEQRWRAELAGAVAAPSLSPAVPLPPASAVSEKAPAAQGPKTTAAEAGVAAGSDTPAG